MLNQSLNDRIVYVLQNVETPAAPRDLLPKLMSAPKARSLKLLYAMPISVAAVAGAAIFAMTLFTPAASYAEVVHKLKEQTIYTISDSLVHNGKVERVIATRYRDGDLWRWATTFGLRDRTVMLCTTHDQLAPEGWITDYAVIDDRKPAPREQFQPEKLLWPDGKPEVRRNVTWNGRIVDIFHQLDTYEDESGGKHSMDQELIIDPKTSLPIRLVRTEETGYGDQFDFDYKTPPANVFEPDMPKSADVFDLRQQRQEVADLVAKGAQAVLFVGRKPWMGPYSNVLMLPVETALDPQMAATLDIDGTGSFSGQMGGTWRNGLHPEKEFTTMPINRRQFGPIIISDMTEKQVNALGATFNGKLHLNGKTQSFKNIPVVRTGAGMDLAMSLLN